MSSKEEMLDNIRKNTKLKYPKPDIVDMKRLCYPDQITQFCRISEEVGGAAIVLSKDDSIDDVIRRNFPDDMRIASLLPEVSCATFNPNNITDPKELNGTDIAVVEGLIGVAENGAVWVPQVAKYRALYFVSEKLVIILDRKNIVNTMFEAYEELVGKEYGYGVFVSGPSKTADIEQALVLGAHGPRTVLVIIK